MEQFILYNGLVVLLLICLFIFFARISDVLNNKTAKDIIVILGVATAVCILVFVINLFGLLINCI